MSDKGEQGGRVQKSQKMGDIIYGRPPAVHYLVFFQSFFRALIHLQQCAQIVK